MVKAKRRGLVFTVVGVFLALLVALLLFSYLNRLERQVGEKSSIVVADQDIPAGTMITEDMLTYDEIPTAYIRRSYLTDTRRAVGTFTVIYIGEGDPVQWSALGQGLRLEHGMRAMTIDVNRVTGVGGLLGPGDRVDVIVSYVTAEAETNKTELLWQDVEVLAVGTATAPEPPAGTVGLLGPASSDRTASSAALQEPRANSVTLALRPEDAVKLTYLSNFGKEVRLVIRSKADDDMPSVAPVTSDDFAK
jgi:pilus assembly protein CpaB